MNVDAKSTLRGAFLLGVRKLSDEPTRDAETEELVSTVADYDAALQQAITEAASDQVAARVKRHRTYLSSEIPVRPCTADCPHRSRCKDFLTGRVQDDELCKPELRQIKKWQAAFRRGDLESLKDDVGAVAGSMAVQVGRLLEAVIADGVVVETTKFQGGVQYKEKMAHPALQQAANILKTLGIDLNSFLMTPKSQKDGPPPVQVNIGISANEVHARFQARYDRKPVDDSG